MLAKEFERFWRLRVDGITLIRGNSGCRFTNTLATTAVIAAKGKTARLRSESAATNPSCETNAEVRGATSSGARKDAGQRPFVGSGRASATKGKVKVRTFKTFSVQGLQV
jgi:hypothetical protein